MLLSIADQTSVSPGDIFSAVSAEQVFGGVILTVIIWLIMSGKMRVEREIVREKEIVKIHEETIEQQRETIRALTSKDRETLHLLRELRTAAIARGDLTFGDLVQHEEIGSDHD